MRAAFARDLQKFNFLSITVFLLQSNLIKNTKKFTATLKISQGQKPFHEKFYIPHVHHSIRKFSKITLFSPISLSIKQLK